MTQGAQNLDLEAVAGFMAQRIEGFTGPLRATKFEIGQSNPTFRLDSPSGFYVLRRKPPGVLLKSAHAIDREYRVQSALAATDVPVPRMRAYCEDAAVIGSEFYIMDLVAGRNLPLPTLEGHSPDQRSAIMAEMNRVLAVLHDVDITQVGLADYGPEGNYYARQIARWTKQYKATETISLPAMDVLMRVLPDVIPPEDGQRRLVHGDYRIDNMIFEPQGAGCMALLDWELSTIGHPYADVAAVIMQWQFAPDARGRGLAGLDRAALGLPSDEAFVAQYCDRRGLDGIPVFGFYLGFCFFRFAAILQGVYRRALEGNASNPEAGLMFKDIIPELAERGLAALRAEQMV